MKPLVVFSLLVAGVAAQHSDYGQFDANAIIRQQLQSQIPATKSPVAQELPPLVREMPQRPIQTAPIQQPLHQMLERQQVQPVQLQASDRAIVQLPGHLSNQMARLQVPKGPHRFISSKPKVPEEYPIQTPKETHRFSPPKPNLPDVELLSPSKSKISEGEPIRKWESASAHEFDAGVKLPIEHTQSTPEMNLPEEPIKKSNSPFALNIGVNVPFDDTQFTLEGEVPEEEPIDILKGSFSHQLGTNFNGTVEHTEFTPEVVVLETDPFKKWKSSSDHQFSTDVNTPVDHTQYIPEMTATNKFNKQAAVNNFKQVPQMNMKEESQQTQIFYGRPIVF